MNKKEIVERLPQLKRKRGVPRLTTIKVLPPPPPIPDTQRPDRWSLSIFLDNSGEVWLIDDIDDQGFGDTVIYSRVDTVKGGAVESTLLENFLKRLNHPEHKEWWHIVAYGDQGFDFSAKNLNTSSKVGRDLRSSVGKIETLRQRARAYCQEERDVWSTPTIVATSGAKRYNSAGFRGTAGPKTEWLRHVVEPYIHKHYPELQRTLLRDFFETKLGWRLLLFTVPYWESSQPIEQVWAYKKLCCTQVVPREDCITAEGTDPLCDV